MSRGTFSPCSTRSSRGCRRGLDPAKVPFVPPYQVQTGPRGTATRQKQHEIAEPGRGARF